MIRDIISRTRAYNVMCHLKPYCAEFYKVKRGSNFDLTPDNKAEAVVSIYFHVLRLIAQLNFWV